MIHGGTEEEAPHGSIMEGDCVAAVETREGLALVCGVASGHPYVRCNLLSFDNSDGSTGGMIFDASTAEELLQYICAMALQFVNSQRH